MKRKITSAILISIGLGFLWQAVGQTPEGPCHQTCRDHLKACLDAAKQFPGSNLTAIKICDGAYHRCLGNCVH